MKKEYFTLEKIEGSLIEVTNLHQVSYGEVVKIKSKTTDETQVGEVVKIDDNKALVQVYGTNMGVSGNNTGLEFTGVPFEVPLSKEILGRVFNGIAKPIDRGGDIYSGKFYNVSGRPINSSGKRISKKLYSNWYFFN